MQPRAELAINATLQCEKQVAGEAAAAVRVAEVERTRIWGRGRGCTGGAGGGCGEGGARGGAREGAREVVGGWEGLGLGVSVSLEALGLDGSESRLWSAVGWKDDGFSLSLIISISGLWHDRGGQEQYSSGKQVNIASSLSLSHKATVACILFPSAFLKMRGT